MKKSHLKILFIIGIVFNVLAIILLAMNFINTQKNEYLFKISLPLIGLLFFYFMIKKINSLK